MAEDSDNSGVRVKRRLRNSGETVRERTEKLRQLQDSAARPHRRGRLAAFWYGFSWPLRALWHQLARLARFRVFRILGFIVVPKYFRNSYRELKQVTWPGFRQSVALTYAVIIFSLIFGVIVFIVDFGLDKLFKQLILK